MATLPDPLSEPTDEVALAEFLGRGTALVLSGAGLSTESGIPDYRGPDGRLRVRLPMRFQEFMASPEARARYWARSMAGWPRFSSAAPNDAHRAIATLEASGAVSGVVTQNVDGLHQAGGSRTVVELHGSLARVRCMGCDRTESRAEVQERLEASNPAFAWADAVAPNPDGDAVLPPEALLGFEVPECSLCGGVLKPDVVFFGESVPPDRVTTSWSLFERAHTLLVVGSSLSVFSGRRFVLRAVKEGKPVAIVNLGPTRGDDVAELKVERRLGDLLPRVARLSQLRAPSVPEGV